MYLDHTVAQRVGQYREPGTDTSVDAGSHGSETGIGEHMCTQPGRPT